MAYKKVKKRKRPLKKKLRRGKRKKRLRKNTTRSSRYGGGRTFASH